MRETPEAAWEPVDDEVDRVFARLQSVEAPPNFVASVMARVGEQPSAATLAHPSASVRPAAVVDRSAAATVAWLAMQALGTLLVGLAAYSLGHAFWTSGAYDLLALLRDDSEVVTLYGDTYFTALLATLPWLQLGAVALTLAATALTWVYSRAILRLFSGGPASAPR